MYISRKNGSLLSNKNLILAWICLSRLEHVCSVASLQPYFLLLSIYMDNMLLFPKHFRQLPQE